MSGDKNIWLALFAKGPEWSPAKQTDKTISKCFDDYRDPKNSWQILINANITPKKMYAEGWGPIEVQPFCIYIFWNGWLAGLIDPTGGQIAASDGANEDAFIKSLEAAT